MTTAVATLSRDIMLAGPVGSLDNYIHAVGAIPVLSQGDEHALATRFHEQGDIDGGEQAAGPTPVASL